jgi:dihydroorotase
MKILLKEGRVIDPASGRDETASVLIIDGKIELVGAPGEFSGVTDTEVVDCEGKIVAPGLCDIHVHFREPGFEWKETVQTGSQAAVAGGFTTVCCMPNTNPTIDKAPVVKHILDAAKRVGICNVHPIGAITVGRKSQELAPYIELKEAGCVAFSDDGAPVSNANLMRRALEYNKMTGCVLTVHEEEETLTAGAVMNESELSVAMGLKGFTGAAEDILIARDIELARLTGGRVHFQHVSTGRGALLIRRAKEDGINVTAETASHYLILDESAVAGYNTQAKVSMPLRSPADREAILAAVKEGVIDCIASDHAPHENDSKRIEFDKASFGFIGLQSTLPVMMEFVRSGTLTLPKVIDLLTAAPARCMNLRSPSLARGAVADIVVIDPERSVTYDAAYIRSKSKNSPLLGRTLTGVAVRTYYRGREVYNLDRKLESNR